MQSKICSTLKQDSINYVDGLHVQAGYCALGLHEYTVKILQQ